jgi:hypothetical protein
MQKTEEFIFECPGCKRQLNAAEVAATLNEAVLRVELARRNGKRQTPHPGPGRPARSCCPGCGEIMTTSELCEHRVPCVRERLSEIQNKDFMIHLYPKDPDPNPDFVIVSLREREVEFRKLSSMQSLTVELQKIATITLQTVEKIVDIELRGRVIWNDGRQRWDFMSKAAALSRFRQPKRA